MDMALFYYGYTLQGGNYMKEARGVYDKLLKNYPSSKYVPEAHLAFADYFFEQSQLDDAEARYKHGPQVPEVARVLVRVLQDRLDRSEQAALSRTRSRRSSGRADHRERPKNEVLNAASKKDFVRAYAEVGKADQALNAFKRVDRSTRSTCSAILADLYLDQGKSDKAIYVFRELMKQEPTNKNVCLWQYNVAHASLSMLGASNGDKITEIENLVKLWGAIKAKKVLPPAEAQECHDNAAAMSGELARAYHSESAKTKNPETLAYAEKLYKVYLEVFPDAEDFASTQYFYSELLWSRAENEKNARLETEMWENAADEFTDVVKTGKVDDKLKKESAYAAVLGWKNALNVDPRAKQQVALEDEKAKATTRSSRAEADPRRDQKMLAAFDIYIKYINDPKDAELVGDDVLEGEPLSPVQPLRRGDPAAHQDILDHHRDHETAEFSANLLLDMYNRLQKYDELRRACRQARTDKTFLEGKDALKETPRDVEGEVAARQGAEDLEEPPKESKDFTSTSRAVWPIRTSTTATRNDEVTT